MRDPSQTPAQANPASTPSTDLKRRRFLLAAAAGGAGAAAAVVPARAVVAASTDAVAGESSGYRETEHIKRYYDTTRL
jgi:Rieske Fe-S protein